MDKKKRDGYVAGIGRVFGFAILLTLAVNNEWNTSGQILQAFTVIFGGLGVGCLWKPETFGAAVSKYFERFSESEKGTSDSHNRQIHKETSGSVQVMGDRSNININVPETKKKQVLKSSTIAKTFSCPKGHGNTVYPPDNNHPTASAEEDYAKKYALRTVIPRKYTCEDCGSEFTLYWHQERIGGSFA